MAGPKLPVNIDTAYANSSTDPSIQAHQQAHDTVHRIVNTFDTALGTASTGQVLTWNGTTYAPAAPAAGGASLKPHEDAARAIYALAPSKESGLTAVAADGGTDDAPRIQAMLDYLKKSYGGGQLILPAGRKSNCNSTITIPAGVQVVGSTGSVWDFWYAGPAATAVVVQDEEATPIIGLTLRGNQWEANRPTHNTTSSTGLKITGHGLNFVDVHVAGFNWGVDFTNDHTFLVSFERSSINGCMVAINLDLDNTWSGASSSVTNSGERMTFTNCVMANNDTVYWATGNGVGLFFVHTSMDFCTTWGRQANAHVFLDNCHLETTYAGRNRYLFDVTVNARLYFVNCLFILGTPGIYHAVNPGSAPWNLGWGMVHFTSCNAAYNLSPGAKSAGAINTAFSEALVSVPAGATSVVVGSFFVSKWNPIKASVVSYWGPAADVTARVSAVSVADATVTVTLSKPAPAGTCLQLEF